jgi:hypothetical protein
MTRSPDAEDAAPPATQDDSERTQGQRGRNRGGSSQRGGKDKTLKPIQKGFTGKEENLGDEFVYQHTVGREASDQYSTTTDEIIRYSSTKYKNGADVERSLSDARKLVIPLPPAPIGTGNPPVIPDTDLMVWKMQVQISLQRASLLDSNLESSYAMIKGQCSKSILEKVEAQQNYTAVHQARSPIGLLDLIKGVMFNYNSRKYRAIALVEIIKPDLVSQTRYMTDIRVGIKTPEWPPDSSREFPVSNDVAQTHP